MTKKKMVTIASLRRQIKAKRAKIDRAQKADELAIEKGKLSKQLRVLSRSPGTRRNIALVQRTGRGFKRLAFLGGKALVKQAKLIREQQLRDDAAIARSGRVVGKKLKQTNKKIGKGLKRKRRRK